MSFIKVYPIDNKIFEYQTFLQGSKIILKFPKAIDYTSSTGEAAPYMYSYKYAPICYDTLNSYDFGYDENGFMTTEWYPLVVQSDGDSRKAELVIPHFSYDQVIQYSIRAMGDTADEKTEDKVFGTIIAFSNRSPNFILESADPPTSQSESKTTIKYKVSDLGFAMPQNAYEKDALKTYRTAALEKFISEPKETFQLIIISNESNGSARNEEGSHEVVILDASEAALKNYILYGKSEKSANSQEIISVGKIRNLFDKTKATKGSRIITTNGQVETISSNQAASDFISVLPNISYVLNFSYYSSGNYGMAFYDSSKNYISGAKQSNNNANSETEPFIFTTPNDCYYIRFSSGGGIEDNTDREIMLNEGSTALSYSPYTGLPEVETIITNEDGTLSQSYIHTLAEPLRGIGDVRDEIDFARGIRTTKIGEKIVDGTMVQYVLETPVEIPLSKKELAKFAQMKTYFGYNSISTDSIADFSIEYIKNNDNSNKDLDFIITDSGVEKLSDIFNESTAFQIKYECTGESIGVYTPAILGLSISSDKVGFPPKVAAFQIKENAIRAQMQSETQDSNYSVLSTGAGMFNHSNNVGLSEDKNTKDSGKGHSIALYDTHTSGSTAVNQPSIGFMNEDHSVLGVIRVYKDENNDRYFAFEF